jgi:hypothetical protein
MSPIWPRFRDRAIDDPIQRAAISVENRHDYIQLNIELVAVKVPMNRHLIGPIWDGLRLEEQVL